MTFYASISAAEVHDRASGLVQQYLKFKDYRRKCLASSVMSVLLYAASRVTSLSDACARLRDAPSDETLRQALLAWMPKARVLERRINRALSADLPQALRKGPQRLAIDLHEAPYHGLPQQESREICRSKPKCGTSHFHTYATAYVFRKGHRFTLALTWVRQDDTLPEVLKRLLAQVHRIGVKVRFLLLDRGFYSAQVVRYLQAARCPFLMPVKCAGQPPKDPRKRATGLRRFFHQKRSGWGVHTWRNAAGQKATVSICVSCRNYAGRWKKRGRQALVYAYWGFRPGSCNWVRATYRRRFGIETSYRQANQARIRTSARDPLRRLLFLGVALVLRNVWVWFHLIQFGKRHGSGVTLRLAMLRFRALLLALQHFAEMRFGVWFSDPTQLRQCKQLATKYP